MAAAQSVSTDIFYQQPIPETSNIRFVENRIIVDAHHVDVYNFVTTWANLPEWLPVAKSVSVRTGNPVGPAQLGDVLVERVHREAGFDEAQMVADKVYTVVARVEGALWVVAGVDEGQGGWFRNVATFITTPLDDGRTLFCRLFQQIRKDTVEMREERHPVLQPAAIQHGLERLKARIEEQYPKGGTTP